MYGFLFLLMGLQLPEGWGAAFGSLAVIYGAGFLGIVAGYFWARWFVIGLGLWGLSTGIISMLQLQSIEPILVFFVVSHAALAAMLWGTGMAKLFDGRQEWRQRFHLDETGTNRLGKSVIRIGASLPYVVLFALTPREGAALALIGGSFVVAGAWGVSQMRSWALPALAAGALTMLASIVTASSVALVPLSSNLAINLDVVAFGAIGFTLLALTPFLGPVARFLKSDD